MRPFCKLLPLNLKITSFYDCTDIDFSFMSYLTSRKRICFQPKNHQSGIFQLRFQNYVGLLVSQELSMSQVLFYMQLSSRLIICNKVRRL